MKLELELKFRDITLGIKKHKNPKKDKHQYLVIDECEVKTFDKNEVYILVNKFHIKEYEVNYCVDCLAEGKRNREAPYGHYSSLEKWNRCKDHYAQYMRKKEPSKKCPKCEKGCLVTCGIEGEDDCCTHCDYRKNVRPVFALFGIETLENRKL